MLIIAFQHFKSTSGDDMQLTDLKLPFKFCLQRQTHARLLGDSRDKTGAVWETREEQWKAFRKSRGQKDILLHSGKAPVNGKLYLSTKNVKTNIEPQQRSSGWILFWSIL